MNNKRTISLAFFTLISLSTFILFQNATIPTIQTSYFYISSEAQNIGDGTKINPFSSIKNAIDASTKILLSGQRNIQFIIQSSETSPLIGEKNIIIPSSAIPNGNQYKFILRSESNTKKAFIDGKDRSVGFLTFKFSNNNIHNIEVRDIDVKEYFEGITFRSNSPTNKILINLHDSVFENIGNIAGNENGAMAVIRLLNITNGKFTNNLFKNIQNYGAGKSALHAYYVADNSSNNEISNSRFEDILSGAAIKIRNRSHDNAIINNTFLNTPQSAVLSKHQESICVYELKNQANIVQRTISTQSPNLTKACEESRLQCENIKSKGTSCSENLTKRKDECYSLRTLVKNNKYSQYGSKAERIQYYDDTHCGAKPAKSTMIISIGNLAD